MEWKPFPLGMPMHFRPGEYVRGSRYDGERDDRSRHLRPCRNGPPGCCRLDAFWRRTRLRIALYGFGGFFERDRDISGAAQAPARILFEAAPEETAQRFRDVLRQTRPVRFIAGDRTDDIGHGLARECPQACQGLI